MKNDPIPVPAPDVRVKTVDAADPFSRPVATRGTPMTAAEARELDDAIVLEVMGWGMINYSPWSPSTSIADAWDVVEKIGGRFDIIRDEQYNYHVIFNGMWDYRVYAATTAPEAICRAARAYVRREK